MAEHIGQVRAPPSSVSVPPSTSTPEPSARLSAGCNAVVSNGPTGSDANLDGRSVGRYLRNNPRFVGRVIQRRPRLVAQQAVGAQQ